MDGNRLPSPLLFLVVMAGCCASVNSDNGCAFVKAEVKRVHVQPGAAKTVTLTGERLAELVEYFPGAGTGRRTSLAASGITGFEIVLHRANGRTARIAVPLGMGSWSEGHGSWWLDPKFAAFVDAVLPPSPTTRGVR